MMNVSEILPLLTINADNGSHSFNTRARCIDAKTVECGRLPLLSILRGRKGGSYARITDFKK